MKRCHKIRRGRSKIHGTGVFAARVLQRGEVLKDHCARYSGYNHSCEPNVVLTRCYHDQLAVAVRHIARGEELTVDYRLTAYHRNLGHGIENCRCPCCNKRGRVKA